MISQRKYERVPTLVLLSVEEANSTKSPSRAAVINLSMGGSAIETNAKFYLGDHIVLRFSLAKDKFFVFEGIIKRISEGIGVFNYGVEFKDLTSSDKKNLKKLIKLIGRKQ